MTRKRIKRAKPRFAANCPVWGPAQKPGEDPRAALIRR